VLVGDAQRARAAYERRMAALVELLTPAMPGSPAEQAERAWALVASIVGAASLRHLAEARIPSSTIPMARSRCASST
jgi:hypothetical protein